MKIWRNIKDFLLSYYYSRGQYFLISFPKTGRTWLIHMISQMNEFNNLPVKNQESFILHDHDSSEIILENGTRNNPLDVFNFTGRLKYRRGKVIFLVRDPRDVVVSHFYQVTKRSKNPFIFKSMSEFVKDDVLGFKRIVHYYNLWFYNKGIPQDFLLVKYENLIENGIEELQQIKSFLNLRILNSDIENIYEESSADKMRNKEVDKILESSNFFEFERNKLKVRNAKIGGYINELSEDDIMYCNQEMKKLNSYFKYKI